MREQVWEYCQLGVTTGRIVRRDGQRYRTYECWVRFYSPDGRVIHHEIARSGVISPVSFSSAMAILGGAGWELVSLQHGVGIDGRSTNITGHLMRNDKAAYFKRPHRQGRATEEPFLNRLDRVIRRPPVTSSSSSVVEPIEPTRGRRLGRRPVESTELSELRAARDAQRGSLPSGTDAEPAMPELGEQAADADDPGASDLPQSDVPGSDVPGSDPDGSDARSAARSDLDGGASPEAGRVDVDGLDGIEMEPGQESSGDGDVADDVVPAKAGHGGDGGDGEDGATTLNKTSNGATAANSPAHRPNIQGDTAASSGNDLDDDGDRPATLRQSGASLSPGTSNSARGAEGTPGPTTNLGAVQDKSAAAPTTVTPSASTTAHSNDPAQHDPAQVDRAQVDRAGSSKDDASGGSDPAGGGTTASDSTASDSTGSEAAGSETAVSDASASESANPDAESSDQSIEPNDKSLAKPNGAADGTGSGPTKAGMGNAPSSDPGPTSRSARRNSAKRRGKGRRRG